jgi:hypothetical protein
VKKESLFVIPPGCICLGDGLLGMECRAPEHATLKDRVIVGRVRSVDGWTELKFACGHSAHIITAIGEGVPVPCHECLESFIRQRVSTPPPPPPSNEIFRKGG